MRNLGLPTTLHRQNHGTRFSIAHAERGNDAMPHFDWRSPTAYEHLLDMDAADLGWELLRRNPDYRNDYSQADRMRALGAGAETLPGPARGWGLTFLDRSGCRRRSPNSVLVAGRPCDDDYSRICRIRERASDVAV